MAASIPDFITITPINSSKGKEVLVTINTSHILSLSEFGEKKTTYLVKMSNGDGYELEDKDFKALKSKLNAKDVHHRPKVGAF